MSEHVTYPTGSPIVSCALHISRPQFTPGLNYVAISRLKSLEGLLFEKPFDLDTLKKGGQGKTVEFRVLDWNRRSNQVISL